MRTWLLTNTTYGTRLPGDWRGSVTSVRDLRANDPPSVVRFEHDIPGEPSEEEIPGLHASAISLLKGPPIYLDLERANLILEQFRETASYRYWTLHAAAIMFDHFHLVVEVPDDPNPDKILADFKAYGSRALNRKFGIPPSKTWWTNGGSKRKLSDREVVFAAIRYVLVKQPDPLVVWTPNID